MDAAGSFTKVEYDGENAVNYNATQSFGARVPIPRHLRIRRHTTSATNSTVMGIGSERAESPTTAVGRGPVKRKTYLFLK